MADRANDIETIYNAARQKPAGAERSEYLDKACGNDAGLRSRVEALVKADEEAGSFLESQPFEATITIDKAPVVEQPGDNIGPYKLLERIGEGGMAVVYMAEQERPFRRRVALKVIKLGMDTKSVIARFEAERQALAMMEHPSIAKVFDAGTTETGRPYFVMELVKGVSITDYCDKNKLDTRERLDLFIQVCNAVQHAHQKGIIHRDIKPSNVMVTLHDDKAVPKVIDFGIAKATSQKLTEKTLFTRYSQMIGTPEYMSPEQAQFSGLDIDTRSDIYSLGVLLYELLTGTTPFAAKDLRSKGYGEIQRIIQETEPPKPSTKLSTMGDALTEIADHRKTNPDLLTKLVRGDLDWIVMKTLEKNRTRRYETASALAADIMRHFADEPVIAGPPSTLYKIEKFIRRNRIIVTAAAMVVSALVAGLIISTTMYLQKKHALDELAKLEIQVEADRSLSTVQKLYAEGRYQAALVEIETSLQRKDVSPKARLLRAHLLSELDRFSDAAAELEKLLIEQPEIAGSAHYLLARILIVSDPNESEKHRQLAESLLPQTAEAYSLRGMTADTPERTVEWLSRALELDPGHYPSRKARAFAYYAVNDYEKMEQDVEALILLRSKDSLGYALRAIVRRQTGRLEDAIRDHDYAIKICDVREELVKLYDQRRETYLRMGDYEAVLEDAQRCVELQPGEFTYNLNIGTTLISLGQYDAARKMYRENVEIGQVDWQIRAESMRYVFCTLGAGHRFELPEDIALEEPFCAIQEAVGYYRTLEKKAVCLIPSVSDQPSLSPDGKQLAYNRAGDYPWQPATSKTGAPVIYRSSGIEILDIDSGKTRLLVSSGKDPAWSPDGRHIAFVRWPKYGAFSAEEIWFIPAAGGEPRRLAKGTWPSWASDSKRVFFRAPEDTLLYSISIDDHSARPRELISCRGRYPGVSPDEKYVAYAVGNELQIVEMSSGSVVTKWTAPGHERGMIVKWSPDGKEIFIGGFLDSDLGLWCFDVQRKEAWQIFDAPVMRVSRSLDRSRIAVDLRAPFGGIWLVKLDPNVPTYQSLAPVFTREEFLRRKCEQYTRALKSNALDSSSYYYAIRLIDNLTSQGKEYYEKGAYKEALTMLVGADDLHRAAYKKSRSSDTAFIVMSLFHLGRVDEATAALERLRALCKEEQFAEDQEAQGFLAEAEKLIEGEEE